MNFAMLEIQSMQKNKLNCTDYTARVKIPREIYLQRKPCKHEKKILRCISDILPLHLVHFVDVAWNNMEGFVTLNLYCINANYRHYRY